PRDCPRDMAKRDRSAQAGEAPAGPRPVSGALAEPGLDWVVEHIAARVRPVLFRLERIGGEPILEEMPAAPVSEVEALCVDAVEPMHPRGQRRTAGKHYGVKMRRHQAPGVVLRAEPIPASQ